MVLLFVLLPTLVRAWLEPCDTIILDGKYLVIEKEELNKKEFEKHRPPDENKGGAPPKKFAGDIAFAGSLNAYHTTTGTNISGFETLENFIGNKHKFCWAPEAMLSFCYRFNSKLCAQLGMGYGTNCHSFKAFGMNEPGNDSILQFRNPQRGILEKVFIAVLDSLGAELDSTEVLLKKDVLLVRYISVPLGIRWNTLPNKKTGAYWYYSIGGTVAFQNIFIPTTRNGGALMLVHSDGHWQPVSSSDLHISPLLLSGQIGAGRSWRVADLGNDHNLLFALGLNLFVPLGAINNATVYSINSQHLSVEAAIRYTFGKPAK